MCKDNTIICECNESYAIIPNHDAIFHNSNSCSFTLQSCLRPRDNLLTFVPSRLLQTRRPSQGLCPLESRQ